MSARYCIYIKDEVVIEAMDKNKNKSEYVERAVRFYIENKDVIKSYANDLTTLKKLISNKWDEKH